jgi:hypothetical protein
MSEMRSENSFSKAHSFTLCPFSICRLPPSLISFQTANAVGDKVSVKKEGLRVVAMRRKDCLNMGDEFQKLEKEPLNVSLSI